MMITIIKSCIRCRIIADKIMGREYLGETLTYMSAIVLAAAPFTGIFMIIGYFVKSLNSVSGRPFYICLLVIGTLICVVLKFQGYYAETKEYVDSLDEKTLMSYRKKDMIVVITSAAIYILALIIIITHALLTQE